MAKLVFVDFETFGIPGTPELIWQFAYAHMDTSLPRFWENVDYFSGLIDWSNIDLKCVSPGSREFTNQHTPDAFDWVTKKKPSPYPLFTRREFAQKTVEWFRSHECAPDQAGSDWTLVGRYPKFDYHCFPEKVRELIGLDPFKCQDVALLYAGMCKTGGRKGKLPSLDEIKSATDSKGTLTHHDALLDIKDEIALTLEAWRGINAHWKARKKD